MTITLVARPTDAREAASGWVTAYVPQGVALNPILTGEPDTPEARAALLASPFVALILRTTGHTFTF